MRGSFFPNVSAAHRLAGNGGQGSLVGKVLGGCNGDDAVQILVGFDNGRPAFQKRGCKISELGYSSHAFRDGLK